MKKLLEYTDSVTQTIGHDGLGVENGLVDAIPVDIGDGSEYASLLDNAVKLEKGQEAVFKVTVTTTVELVDVRMAESARPEKELAGMDYPYPDEYEGGKAYHADGCGFFYGNPCECGWKPPVVKMVVCPHGYREESPGTCNCWPKDEHGCAPVPTTQTPPKQLVWECASCSKQSDARGLSPHHIEGYRLMLGCSHGNGWHVHTLKALP